MPELSKMLSKVKIISARTDYEELFPTDIEQWKIHAFLQAKLNVLPDVLTNIIAVSDSERDIAAAHNLAWYGA